MAERSRRLIVNVVGDARGLSSTLSQAESRLGGFAGRLGGVAATGVAAFGALAVGAGAALFKVGSDFDAAFDTIRIGTGATGEALEGLEDSFRNVARSTPSSLGDVGTAIADLNTRLGLTGEPLEALTEQFLDLSRITGTDVGGNVANLTRVLGDWGVAVEDQAGAIDAVFRASQATGATVDTLGSQVVQFGAPMRQLGFSFEETLGLLGQFEREGVNTELVMGSMRIALGKMARDGEPAIETFERVTSEIAAAGSASEANALALELFGARAGPDMAAAIREGRFELGDLLTTIADGSETITGVADETASAGEKFAELKNRALVGLEPVASRVFDSIGDGLDVVMDLADVFSERGLSGVLEEVKGLFSDLGDRIVDAWPDIRDALETMARGFVTWVQEVSVPLLRQLGELLAAVGSWVVNTGAPWLADKVAEWANAFIEWVGPKIGPFLREVGRLIGAGLDWLLNEGVPLAVEKLGELARAFVEWVGPAIPPMLEELSALIGDLLEWIVTDALPELVGKLVEWAGAFAGWIATDAIPGLLRELPKMLTAIGDWIVTTGIPTLLTKAGELGGALLTGLSDKAGETVDTVVGFITGLPGRVLDASAGLWSAAFQLGKDLVNGIIDAWNRLDLSVSFSIPSWVPVIGGNSWDSPDLIPDIPRLHTGGIVPGRYGEEMLAILEAGEQVIPADQVAAGAGMFAGPGIHIEHAHFGDQRVVADLDWWARSRLSGA